MWKLTYQLAGKNLLKNRKLYYPYALVTVLSAAIFYIFTSLSSNPHLAEVRGAGAIFFVLRSGRFVVALAVAMMIFYANSVVMKNRSKELGLYSILGLEKRHLLVMTLLESLLFALSMTLLGLVVGLVLDQLFYALLLKIMQVKVVLVSTFQWANVGTVFLIFGVIFVLVSLLNAGKLGLSSSLALVKGKKRGEKKGRLLLLQTIIGLAVLATAYYLSQTVTTPAQSLFLFFIATLLVILATYLLFNAGIVSFLQWLKKRESYYYKPANFISVSNLVFRMRKNAMGLATITILSTMFLVTMVGGVNIYHSGREIITQQNPQDFIFYTRFAEPSEAGQPQVDADFLLKSVKESIQEVGLPYPRYTTYTYRQNFFTSIDGQRIGLLEDGNGKGGFDEQSGPIYVFSEKDYQDMTGEKLELRPQEMAIYSQGQAFQLHDKVQIGEQTLEVKAFLPKDATKGGLPLFGQEVLPQFVMLVVKDLDSILSKTDEHYYVGVDTDLAEEEQTGLYEALVGAFLPHMDQTSASVTITSQAYELQDYFAFAGSLMFIGIFLSLVFLMATSLVIYYKQISEGYEDRERFVMMHKVGLDEAQMRSSVRKQMLTVFFLPIGMAFLHLAFAYKMLSNILLLIGAGLPSMIFRTTLATCLLYLLLYVLVYLLSSRSYRKIISSS